MIQNDTIIALATPSGVGAISVIRLSGEKSIELTNRLFRGKNLIQQKTHTAHFGYIIDGDTEVDEVLITVFKNCI